MNNQTPPNISHSPDALAQRKQELLDLFKQAAPELIRDNHLDLNALKALLGEDRLTQKEHYELSWAGKSAARREIQKTTSHTLRPAANNPEHAQHMLIEGENLEVLRVLQKSYYGKVKMIYIDPPYNTGNDSFVYPDDYSETLEAYRQRTGEIDEQGLLNKQSLWKKNSKENGHYHSVWLSMMYPRLYLARNLLRDDGVIFISIDDNEAANLKLLCDEVFGEENFVSTIIWRKKYGLQNDAKYFSISHENLIVFAKDKLKFRLNLVERTEEQDNRYKNIDDDSRGAWKSADLSVGRVTEKDRYKIITPSGREILPPEGRSWVVSEDKFKEMVEDNRIWFGKTGNNVPSVKKFLSEVKQGLTPSTFWDYDEVGHTDGSNKALKRIFNNQAFFDYPKPVEYLKKILTIGCNSDGIILDFFAGSGTTAHAVMALNLEDGGNRQCILVQLPEKLAENSEAYKAGYRTIADITRARIDKVMAKLKAEYPDKTQDLACAYFTLAPSNFKVWRSDLNSVEEIEQQLEAFQKTEKAPAADGQDNLQTNMLTELLLKNGLGVLGVHAIGKATSMAGVTVHRVLMPDDKRLWLCFEPYSEGLKEEIVKAKPAQVILLNSCFTGDNKDEALSNLQLELAGLDIGLWVI
ncbi:type III restriction endonuclease StyLTI [Candidatus Nitrosoglobus terrae]|uniref:site-specific DNA-methyltransferase (adenine-specific) n=2 Tax=Candidatus Nitrosoglobus terrae TaxID=1630141 RepID=A0A1Q2SPI9_9GAMM|nr:type III restriction endonuclease StyLTI [Candidatus Nitrosoglobus terrae]